MKKITGVFFLSCIILASCKKKNFNEEVTNPANTTPVITGIVPVAAQFGNTVTVKGKNFGSIASIVTLKINSVILTYTLVNDSALTVVIPKGLGSGAVVVTKNNVAANGPNFEYLYTGNVTTFSGNGDISPTTGTALQVGYKEPFGLCLDTQNNLYVTDAVYNHFRKIDAGGNVTLLQGFTGTNYSLGDIIIDNQTLYFTLPNGHIIFSFNNNTGGTNLEAGYYSTANYIDASPPDQARFNTPFYIAKNNRTEIFISDYNNNAIRKLIIGQSVSTYAGNNIAGDVNANGNNARFKTPTGIYADKNNEVFICDAGNAKIKKIAVNKDVTTIAGTTIGYQDGTAATAKFNQPLSITKDDLDNIVVTDINNTIRCISPSGFVYTLAGVNSFNAGAFANGSGASAKFNVPAKIIFAGNKIFYIADTQNRRIRKMILE